MKTSNVLVGLIQLKQEDTFYMNARDITGTGT